MHRQRDPVPPEEWLKSAEFRRLVENRRLISTFVPGAAMRRSELSLLREQHPDIAARIAGNERLSAEARTTLLPLLRAVGLEGGGFEVIVYAEYTPSVLLAGRSAVLLPSGLLGLLDGPELRAVAAHEVGHLYAYSLYGSPVSREESGRPFTDAERREVELQCDSMAVVLSGAAGDRPDALSLALRKIEAVKARLEQSGRMIPDRRAAAYCPTLRDREDNIQQTVRALAALKTGG
jgi:hypothetical protein